MTPMNAWQVLKRALCSVQAARIGFGFFFFFFFLTARFCCQEFWEPPFPSQCCNSLSNCSQCTSQNGCDWCVSPQPQCLRPRQAACNTTSPCCSSLNSCDTCNTNSACGWCSSTGTCQFKSDLSSCSQVADAKCCSTRTSCGGCQSPDCNWCSAPLPAPSQCVPSSSQCPAAGSVVDVKCCSDYGNCSACHQNGVDCSYCDAGASGMQCAPSQQQCAGRVLSRFCCESNPDCPSCHANGCTFCLGNGECRQQGDCVRQADAFCCDVALGASCAGCVSLTGCSFCTSEKSCKSTNCSTVQVTPGREWQCGIPEVLNCESFSNCSDCVASSGCVWAPLVWIDGVPQPSGLCYTGNLFGLSNNMVAGFVISTPAGFYWGTCSLTATSVWILIGGVSGGVLLLAVVIVIVCCVVRRRRLKQAQGDSGEYSVVNDHLPQTDFSAPDVASSSSSAASTENHLEKKKKKRTAKSVPYKPADSVRATNTRYYQARQKK